jgi:hypothetical protein
MTPDHAKAAQELLAFYVESGVDALVDEAPINRFADADGAASDTPKPLAAEAHAGRPQLAPRDRGEGARPSKPVPPAPAVSAAAAPLPPDVAAMAARDAARQAQP